MYCFLVLVQTVRGTSHLRALLPGLRPVILTRIICPTETANYLNSQSVLVKIVNILRVTFSALQDKSVFPKAPCIQHVIGHLKHADGEALQEHQTFGFFTWCWLGFLSNWEKNLILRRKSFGYSMSFKTVELLLLSKRVRGWAWCPYFNPQSY